MNDTEDGPWGLFGEEGEEASWIFYRPSASSKNFIDRAGQTGGGGGVSRITELVWGRGEETCGQKNLQIVIGVTPFWVHFIKKSSCRKIRENNVIGIVDIGDFPAGREKIKKRETSGSQISLSFVREKKKKKIQIGTFRGQ